MNKPDIKRLGLQPYTETWEAMRHLTQSRDAHMRDEIWLLEHPAVFTQGKAGKMENIIRNPSLIPIIWSDRGGQITYHGPGQIIIYLLLNLHRLKLGIRQLVNHLEQAIIQTLNTYDIIASSRSDAPGVYVNQKKIASIGLRVRKGFTYHGLSFNFHMDLTPFSYINPCGFEGLKIVQLQDILQNNMPSKVDIENRLLSFLIKQLGYSISHD